MTFVALHEILKVINNQQNKMRIDDQTKKLNSMTRICFNLSKREPVEKEKKFKNFQKNCLNIITNNLKLERNTYWDHLSLDQSSKT